MKHFQILVALLLPFLLSAQLVDDFGDGNFTNSPAWSGNTADFEIASNVLHSIGPQASSVIYLSTANTLIDSTEWNFFIRLDFNPSSTNQVRVFLVSDQADLSGSLNGYFVQFGEAGTAPDSLDIFRQNGTTITKVFTGVSGIMNSASTNTVRIRVVRHAGGAWDVFADKTGGTNLTAEGSFFDNNITATNYFGVVCDYSTASRYNLYYFDDFSIGNIVTDTIKPVVSSVNVLSATAIDIKFSEPVDLTSAQNATNYFVNNSIGNPSSVTRDAADFSLVHLSFSNALQNAASYLLNIVNVKDINGNSMNAYNYPFSFFNAGAYDVLINEIMADPSPMVGLPDVEFVELYNTTQFPILLSGWTFSDATSTVTLPNATILPDSFIIICANASADSFLQSGFSFTQLAVVPTLPSLNNSGDNLLLKNNFGNVIHGVNYIDDWYNSSVKRNGGWTLELINPENPCQNNNNWTASNSLAGGTPGKKNSVYNTNNSSQFSLTGVDVISATEIVLQFNETLDQTSAETESNYAVNNSVGSPTVAVVDSFDFSKIHLSFSTPLDSSLIYTITVNVANCAGSSISSQNSYQFAIPKAAEKFDVLINEIFPDPDPQVGLPNAEYIELYNRSNRAINLKDWELSKNGTSAAVLPNYLLLPDSLVIITSNTNGILFSAFSNTIAVSSFPSLTNEADNLLLKNSSGNLIHYVEYDISWYHDIAKQDGGWSLELIDAQNPCNGKENWHASQNTAGGTPGQINSVVAANPDTVSPYIIRAALQDENTLLLLFSEPINNGNASIPANYTVSNNVGNPALALPMPFSYTTVQLEFVQNFQSGIIYTISVSSITDCSGNQLIANDSVQFAISDTAQSGDIVINEILFNPRTGGYDFVELYNRSNKVVDLKQLDIVEKDFINPEVVLELSACSDFNYLLFPHDYVVLSENAENIKQEYFCSDPDKILQTSLPNYDDNESVCVIKIHNGPTIDSLAFQSKWHFALLDVEDGVSLERIDFNGNTQDRNNWHSAASTVGFATPTYLNSQYSATGIADDAVQTTPEVFTPDNDGEKDFVFVQYSFTEPGYTCNIRIYDTKGREIKSLIKNELLGSSGQFQWDGINDEGQKARIGIYIAAIEVFNLKGKVKRFSKNITLGGKLD